MRSVYRMVLVGVVAGFLMGSVASAATISDVTELPWDPTTDKILDSYGYSGHFISYSDYDGATGLFNAGGLPQYNAYAPEYNPPELLFAATAIGGGGTGGGATGGACVSTYVLGNKLPGGMDWGMTFSVLFFDEGFAGTSVTVELLGSFAGGDYKSYTIDAAAVTGGTLLSWDIVGGYDAGTTTSETVNITITAVGDCTYAAGFFMDNAYFNVIPEPATMALMGLGGLGMFVLRRRRR